MAKAVPGIKKIVAVASGKGGVGKTTITVNLSLALRERGLAVGLFDADVYGPNVPLMLGVTRDKTARSTLIPVARANPVPYIDPLERFGLKVMSFGFILGETDTVVPESRFLGQMVERTLRDVKWGELDILVVDLPPGSGEPQQSLVENVTLDGVIVVTTPQDLSLMDAGRSLGLYRKAHVPVLGIVENMSYLDCPHCSERIEVFHQTERPWAVHDPSLELLGRVPMTHAISRGISSGHPLVVSEPAGKRESDVFREVAAAVAGRLF